jgi:hypothetical protein
MAEPSADQGVEEAVWREIDPPAPAEPAATEDNGQLLVALAAAERQLEDAKHQIAQLESLLEELPEIFERKFQQRLQPVMERQQQLLADKRHLQQHIQRLAPAPGEVRLRFNPIGAADGPGAVQLPQLPQPRAGQRQHWGDRIGRRRRAA